MNKYLKYNFLNKFAAYVLLSISKMWKIRVDSNKRWIIELLGYEYHYNPVLEEIPDNDIENFIKCKIIEMMTFLLDCLKNTKPLTTTEGYRYPNIRIMEDR